MTDWILFAIAMALALCTLLPAWRHEHWLVRGLDFPRLQIAVLLCLVLLAQCLLLSMARPLHLVTLALTVFSLCWQGWWIFPYSPLMRAEVKRMPRDSRAPLLSILNANVLTPNRRAQDLIDIVRNEAPDILVTLESDHWWEQQLSVLEPDYPYNVKVPLDNLYGMHVYSRLPLKNIEVQYLVEDDKPSVHADVELPDGISVEAHFLHPAPPSPTENEESTERDAELVMVAKRIQGSRRPAIVAGDLNDVAWSETTRLFRKISGLLDPRVGRGMFNTFHADYWFLRFPLDHLFHSDHFTLSRIKRLPHFGSDHFPLLIELAWAGELRHQQNGLEPDADDRALAAEKLDNVET